MSDSKKPVRARPVAPPVQQPLPSSTAKPAERPLEQPPQQPPAKPAQSRPITIETLAYELFEIRQYMRRSMAARKRAGMLYLIWGGVFVVCGMFQGPVDTLAASLTGTIGVVLMIVGGGMRYDPDKES